MNILLGPRPGTRASFMAKMLELADFRKLWPQGTATGGCGGNLIASPNDLPLSHSHFSFPKQTSTNTYGKTFSAILFDQIVKWMGIQNMERGGCQIV